MKKIFMVLVVLFLIYFGIQVGYSFFGSGHKLEYTVTTEEKNFLVKEEFSNKKDDTVSYFFEITYNGDIFYYQTSHDFRKSKSIIKNIYYYHDNEYSCILPIYENNQIISDILCKKGDIIYNYHDIKGQDKALDNYAFNLKEKGYNGDNFTDNSNVLDKGQLTIYENNLIDKTYYALTNYKGLYLINSVTGGKMQDIAIFKKDVYKRPISIFFQKYYVVADYDKDYRFDTFYVVDITSGKIKEINVGKEVSFDGYVQGVENNSIYFFDKTYKIQYEINLKTNKVIEVGNEKTGIKVLKNGEWERVPAIQAVNENILFKTNVEEFNNYENVYKLGINSGYYYLYDKTNNFYKTYRSNIQNKNQKLYLFDTSDIDRVIYDNNYVYYVKDNCIKYYTDKLGVKNLVCDNELNYNTSIKFGVYTD